MIEALVENGADTEAVYEGDNPLLLAVCDENAEALTALMRMKANPNCRTKAGLGISALQVALTELDKDEQDKHRRMTYLLLDGNADPNSKTGNSTTTVIHKAVIGKDSIGVRYLLEFKADVNVGDQTGKTPYHLAARQGFDEILSVLLDHKADLNALSKEGSTALNLAEKNRRTKCAELLRRALEQAADSREEEADPEKETKFEEAAARAEANDTAAKDSAAMDQMEEILIELMVKKIAEMSADEALIHEAALIVAQKKHTSAVEKATASRVQAKVLEAQHRIQQDEAIADGEAMLQKEP